MLYLQNLPKVRSSTMQLKTDGYFIEILDSKVAGSIHHQIQSWQSTVNNFSTDLTERDHLIHNKPVLLDGDSQPLKG